MCAMFLQPCLVGPLGTNCYLVGGEDAPGCVIIDPGSDAEQIADAAEEAGRTPELILLTHSHIDHIAAVDALRAQFPACPVACHAECSQRAQDGHMNLSVMLFDSPVGIAPADRLLTAEEPFDAAGLAWLPYHTPGHAPGHLIFHLPAQGVLFTGDVLMRENIGRTDFPGGVSAVLESSLQRILGAFAPGTTVYPGHGPATTIEHERESNPFLLGF